MAKTQPNLFAAYEKKLFFRMRENYKVGKYHNYRISNHFLIPEVRMRKDHIIALSKPFTFSNIQTVTKVSKSQNTMTH